MINATYCMLVDREKQRGSDSITDIERVVLLIWHASGIIENGGFRYFFECGLLLRETAEAYARIGVEEVASIFRRVNDLFPGHEIPADYDERMALVDKFYQQQADLLSHLEGEFYSRDGLMEKQLGGWIRVHRDVFRAIDAA